MTEEKETDNRGGKVKGQESEGRKKEQRKRKGQRRKERQREEGPKTTYLNNLWRKRQHKDVTFGKHNGTKNKNTLTYSAIWNQPAKRKTKN